ncbi:MAG: hypothetical protein PHR77_06180 [Kiritimatiellae bacterium]|nr:hypothetical protein [Kiritimatiellia bacterium]MDD5522933.1 hypothetical protein [Kiritimatiellia bacterium]
MKNSVKVTRRAMLCGMAGICGLAATRSARAQFLAPQDGTVRDRLWIFTCAANSDFPAIGRRSVMTPAEGAFFFGVPNIIMVQSSTKEAPYGRLEPPFAQYTVALRPLKRVVWSVVGSGGFNSPVETEEVLALPKTTPNFAGVMLDDFFTGKADGKRAQLTIEELKSIRQRLKQSNPKFDIMATLYVKHLELPLQDYLEMIDVLTLWNGNSADLVNLDAHMEKVEKLAPRARKMLGCYVVSYKDKAGVPVDLMRHQCETGLRWLRQGRIEGIIFLGNTTMDLGFESVEWTRQWIARVGDQKL